MNISGSIRIFKSEYDGRNAYSTTISNKDQSGKYENMYIKVQLPKDVELDSNTKINITKGFLSFYNTKIGQPKVKAVVQEFEIEAPEQETIVDLYGDDLPF